MKKILPLAYLLSIISTAAVCQTGPENMKEGFLLRRLELASSFAMSNLKSNQKAIHKEGNKEFSYENANKEITTVILNGFEQPKILARYSFDSVPNSTPIDIKTSELSLTPFEENLVKLLSDATNKINNRYGGNFATTAKTYFKAIPVITKKHKKVIVYSKPIKKSKGIVFGNDYELQYDSTYNFIAAKKFHDKPTSIPFNASSGMVTVHEHATSDEISSTDVCTILLNKDNIQWKQHIVLNPVYVAILMVPSEGYIFMMREEFDETMKKQRER
jgi:hypothetical protein